MSAILDAFTRDELQRSQVDELPSALPNNLSNPIHPTYYRSQWDDCPDEVYELFTPSVRLASLMITSQASLIFYDALMHKHRKRLHEPSARLGKECYEFHGFDSDGRDPADPQNLYEVSQEVASLKTHIRCRLIQNVAEQSGHFAVTRRTTVIVKKDDWPCGTESTISVGTDYISSLREVGANGSVSQLLRLQFHVALTFAHELVHAVNHAVSLETYEPFFQDQRLAELGHAWEQAVFGGRPAFLGPTDARNPLIFAKWPTAFKEAHPEVNLERRLPKRTHTFYFIPMTFLAKIQQQGFWAGAGDQNTLTIPKRLGRQISGEGPFDPTWFSQESSEGRHPGSNRGRVTRDDLDDNWEHLDEPGMDPMDWDNFGIELPDDENIKLTQSMIDDFEKDMDDI